MLCTFDIFFCISKLFGNEWKQKQNGCVCMYVCVCPLACMLCSAKIQKSNTTTCRATKRNTPSSVVFWLPRIMVIPGHTFSPTGKKQRSTQRLCPRIRQVHVAVDGETGVGEDTTTEGTVTVDKVAVVAAYVHGFARLCYNQSLFFWCLFLRPTTRELLSNSFLFTSSVVGRRVLMLSSGSGIVRGSVGGACINNFTLFPFIRSPLYCYKTFLCTELGQQRLHRMGCGCKLGEGRNRHQWGTGGRHQHDPNPFRRRAVHIPAGSFKGCYRCFEGMYHVRLDRGEGEGGPSLVRFVLHTSVFVWMLQLQRKGGKKNIVFVFVDPRGVFIVALFLGD